MWHRVKHVAAMWYVPVVAKRATTIEIVLNLTRANSHGKVVIVMVQMVAISSFWVICCR